MQGQKHYPGVIQPVYNRYGRQAYSGFCANVAVMTTMIRTRSRGCEKEDYAVLMLALENKSFSGITNPTFQNQFILLDQFLRYLRLPVLTARIIIIIIPLSSPLR